MTHRFVFRVEVDIEHEEGKFASRADLGDVLVEALEAADPGSISTNSGEYATTRWDIEELEPERRRRSRGLRQVKLHGPDVAVGP